MKTQSFNLETNGNFEITYLEFNGKFYCISGEAEIDRSGVYDIDISYFVEVNEDGEELQTKIPDVIRFSIEEEIEDEIAHRIFSGFLDESACESYSYRERVEGICG